MFRNGRTLFHRESSMRWLLGLPPAARPHGKAAEAATLAGATPDVLAPHLDALLAATPDDRDGAEAVLNVYKQLLWTARQTRDSRHLSSSSVSALVDHLRGQTIRPLLQPDADTGHLALKGLLHHGCPADALALLASLRADAVPLTVGSYDMLIQAAGRSRERRGAYRAYREMRRARVRPTAYTLNAMLNVETRSGRPNAALALFSRALDGAPRWPGEPPDAWSYSTAMAAAMAAGQHHRVGRLFSQVSADPHLRHRITPAAYNLAIEARLRLRDDPAATSLLKRMKEGVGYAPYPRADTFNSMIRALGDRGASYSWVLKEMARCGIQPDTYTCCTMMRLQTNLNSARRVWRWARQRDAASGIYAWHHLAEAHIRHGQPGRVVALLQVMEARDGITPKASSHNLYMRAMIAKSQPKLAVAHFERMAAAPKRGRSQPKGSEEGSAASPPEPAEPTLWLERVPPRPDRQSFVIALQALRLVNTAANLQLEADVEPAGAGATAVNAAGGRRGVQALTPARKVARLVEEAESRGLLGDEGAVPAPMAHALVSACGDDVRSAIALWRDYLRPRLVSARGGMPPKFAPPGEESTADQAALYALLRVCGAARRADEALRVVYAMKKDGCPLDTTCYSAYERGRDNAALGEADDGSGQRPRRIAAGEQARRMLNNGYERILKLELAPEEVELPSALGPIERIRIQFAPPEPGQ